MSSKSPKRPKQPRKGGRKAERLKIEGDWKSAVHKALRKGKPPKERDNK